MTIEVSELVSCGAAYAVAAAEQEAVETVLAQIRAELDVNALRCKQAQSEKTRAELDYLDHQVRWEEARAAEVAAEEAMHFWGSKRNQAWSALQTAATAGDTAGLQEAAVAFVEAEEMANAASRERTAAISFLHDPVTFYKIRNAFEAAEQELIAANAEYRVIIAKFDAPEERVHPTRAQMGEAAGALIAAAREFAKAARLPA